MPVPPKRTLRKVVDEESEVLCTCGAGTIREEVWVNPSGLVVRYNLAFINHLLFAKDNGRVLGYDASHGFHHRHFKGTVAPFQYRSYASTRQRFIREVSGLRKEKL